MMSKTSRFFLMVIIAGLAFIAAVRVYRAYEKRAQEEAAEFTPTDTFNNVPINFTPEPEEPPVYGVLPQEAAVNEVYLEDAPLSAQAQHTQAEQTITSILNDYSQTPQMKAFYQDLQQATGQSGITLAQLSGPELGKMLQQYPQVQQVIAKHAQDPEFAKMMQEIFTNPQFIKSVAVLQGPEKNAR
ncbi:MAG: hypothetical protein IKJ44_05445 [Elusimicrobiaceae bacterium]|nr:hypothetical protein [Elusimicrobiaceae bacterium]MBR3899698.1 hypothetical protein [Elusimicrobiaceae bacterium]